ncbi:uncharacterized protein LOC142620779 [Castanea sativa]|uniref:uncharacterized protein LOC142620779 n=1 Tax=Castanea sativa TaxID=21020 RepID=UPI003F651FA0
MLNLRKRGVATDGICPICGKEAESICHALFRCNIAKEVWSWWKECPIKICVENQDFSDIALGLLCAGTTRDLEILVVTAWAIWYNRKQCVHESKKQVAGQIWDFASSFLSNYKEASKYFQLGPAFCDVSWKKPPMGVYKINVDGATSERERNSSIGVIIRDFKGEAAAGLCRLINANFSVLETEVLAVEAGVLLAKYIGLQQIIIESNSLLPV